RTPRSARQASGGPDPHPTSSAPPDRSRDSEAKALFVVDHDGRVNREKKRQDDEKGPPHVVRQASTSHELTETKPTAAWWSGARTVPAARPASGGPPLAPRPAGRATT